MAFRAATFNAGLAVGVLPYSTERLPHVVRALAALDVDLLFVQEFWLDLHVEALREALIPTLPYSFRPAPLHPAVRGACTAAAVEPLRACAEQHCGALRDEALAICAVRHCAMAGLALPPACLNCIVSHPVGTIHDILDTCIGERDPGATSPASVPAILAASPSGLMAYAGSFGTALFSRYPLTDLDVLVFESTINARGAIHATVTTPTLGALHVFATHLSPVGAEQPAQLDSLLPWMQSKAGGAPTLLIGDLNTTPGSAIFRRIQSAGFREADPPDRSPTYTSTGLGTGDTSGPGWRVDHVFMRGFDPSWRTRSERVLDEPVTLDVQGRQIRSTLSDHFGVLSTLERVG